MTKSKLNFSWRILAIYQGREIAQIYVGNRVSKVEKPTKELRDFVKVGRQLTAILQSDNAQIFENIPLRSLVMADIDPQVVQNFIELANAW